MATVTGVVATYNEEENIADCLRTLVWCDEIVVVDDGSEDATVDIASEYADRIVDAGSEGYHAAPIYQVGIDAAESDYIFMLAADEMVPRQMGEHLREVVDTGSADVVVVPYRNYMFGRWINGAGWQPWGKPRLFRPDCIQFPSNINEVHTEITPTPDATVVELPCDESPMVHHFNYLGIKDFVDRTNRYTSVEAGHELEFRYYKLFGAPVWEFLYRLIPMKGYRLGSYGVVLATLMAWYRFLGYLKCWERTHWGDEETYDREYESIRRSLVEDWNEWERS